MQLLFVALALVVPVSANLRRPYFLRFADGIEQIDRIEFLRANVNQYADAMRERKLLADNGTDVSTVNGTEGTEYEVDTDAGGGRWTTSGCECTKEWVSADGSCDNYCCNPDNDPNGEWCVVVDEECEGGDDTNFGYCTDEYEDPDYVPPKNGSEYESDEYEDPDYVPPMNGSEHGLEYEEYEHGEYEHTAPENTEYEYETRYDTAPVVPVSGNGSEYEASGSGSDSHDDDHDSDGDGGNVTTASPVASQQDDDHDHGDGGYGVTTASPVASPTNNNTTEDTTDRLVPAFSGASTTTMSACAMFVALAAHLVW